MTTTPKDAALKRYEAEKAADREAVLAGYEAEEAARREEDQRARETERARLEALSRYDALRGTSDGLRASAENHMRALLKDLREIVASDRELGAAAHAAGRGHRSVDSSVKLWLITRMAQAGLPLDLRDVGSPLLDSPYLKTALDGRDLEPRGEGR